MYNCKDILSLNVLSLYEGELLGVVDKLFFDKKFKKLVELEIIGEDGVKLSLPTKNIYHIGKNAITIRNNQCVEIKTDSNTLFQSPIDLKAYSIKGEFLGIIKEVCFNEKYLTTSIELENNQQLNPNFIASCSKNTMIFYSKEKIVDVKSFNPNKKLKAKPNKEEKVQAINQENIEAKETIEPPKQKTTLSTDNLIGRICTKDIFNFNNEVLIKAHSVVNKKNLKEIIKFGKVRELMLFSK